MSDGAEVWVTVEQFAVLTGKSVFTVRWWCRLDKVVAKKDPGGRDWLVKIENKTLRNVQERTRACKSGLDDPL